MIGLIQRVSEARVTVAGETVGAIGRGLLVLAAVHRDDSEKDVARLAERILTYRVFPDADGKMNRSVLDEGLGLLLVPQFTLAVDTRKGTRASFTRAAAPALGEDFFGRLVGLTSTLRWRHELPSRLRQSLLRAARGRRHRRRDLPVRRRR